MKTVIIDVRSMEEFREACNPKSINIPLDEFENRINELEKKFGKDSEFVLCCASGGRSAYALEYMKKMGFSNVRNAGGWVRTLGL